MKRNLTRPQHTPSKRRKDASGSGGKGPKTPVEADEDSKTPVEQPPQQTEYYSTLAMAPSSEREAAELSEKGKRDLVRRWLRRKLYEEVQEQAFAFSRGVRDVVPGVAVEARRDVRPHPLLHRHGRALDAAGVGEWVEGGAGSGRR